MRVTRKGKVWRREAEWQQMCTRFAQSGLGPQEFCQREAMAGGSVKKWYPRCAEKGLTTAAFVE
jgi:hypothetical protein